MGEDGRREEGGRWREMEVEGDGRSEENNGIGVREVGEGGKWEEGG